MPYSDISVLNFLSILFVLFGLPFVLTMAAGGVTGLILAHTSARPGLMIGLPLGLTTIILAFCAVWLPATNPPWEELIPHLSSNITSPMFYWAAGIAAGFLNAIATMVIINKLRQRKSRRELAA